MSGPATVSTTVPIYEYVCMECESHFEELVRGEQQVACPDCAPARAHGDRSENFEYHAAKNEQGLLEARIRVLRHRLQHATIVDEEAAAASGVVTVGSRVELERDDGELLSMEITGVGGVSPDSPVGRALLGK